MALDVRLERTIASLSIAMCSHFYEYAETEDEHAGMTDTLVLEGTVPSRFFESVFKSMSFAVRPIWFS